MDVEHMALTAVRKAVRSMRSAYGFVGWTFELTVTAKDGDRMHFNMLGQHFERGAVPVTVEVKVIQEESSTDEQPKED
jgi:hypothetical protein